MSESKGQVENILKELGKKIDGLVEEMHGAKEEFKEEFKDQIHELKEKRDKLQGEFDEFKSQEKWQEAKQHFVSAAMELKRGVEKVFKKD